MYPPETAARICERMADGESLRAICRDEGMPGLSTVMRWADEDPVFREQYARAMSLRADAKFEELDDVSEDAVLSDSAVRIAGLRLKADNIKWQLGKMSPKKYGEKLDLNHSGAVKFEKIECVVVDPAR